MTCTVGSQSVGDPKIPANEITYACPHYKPEKKAQRTSLSQERTDTNLERLEVSLQVNYAGSMYKDDTHKEYSTCA